jgi:hypothetical protein
MKLQHDLSNQRFGKWAVVDRFHGRKKSGVWWNVVCDCGTRSVVSTVNLLGGKSLSCGCGKETQGNLSTTREYNIWSKMRLRCYYELNPNYRYYGGIGTYVCQRWRDSFLAFLEDMGEALSKTHTLDRIETTGSYTCGKCDECKAEGQPLNCRWATKAEQSRNQRSNRFFTHDGKTLILKDWARLSGIPYLTLWNRLKNGMPFPDAISVPRYARKAITRSKQS